MAGCQILRSVIRHAFDHALGVVPEVFSGELNHKLGEAYHHQGFSTTGYMLPLVRGLLGLEVNALSRSIKIAPRLPNEWDTVVVKHVLVNRRAYDITIAQTETSQAVTVNSMDDIPVEIIFAPVPPVGAKETGLWFNQKKMTFKGTSIHQLKRGDQLVTTFTSVPAVVLPRD